jgi:hypothetical protein
MVKFANFEVQVEIEKLKIYVKGDREIAPEIANNVAQQISAVFQPAGLIQAPANGNGHQVIDAPAAAAPARRSRKRGTPAGAPANGGAAAQISWSHDADKWGTPLISWTQPQKINWLLHVADESGASKALSVMEMVNTFNSKFGSAGPLMKGNMARDMKGKSDLFGSVDGRWFLKTGGKEAAVRLVNEAKGGTATA